MVRHLVVAAASVLAIAQPERVTLRMGPVPNQSFHLEAKQEATMEVTSAEAASGRIAPPPVTIVMIQAMRYATTVDSPDADGRYEARFVCEAASSSVTVNGQPGPAARQTAIAPGQSAKVTYDRDGRFVDITIDAGTDVDAVVFRQFLKPVFESLPTLSMSVGETTKTLIDLNLPLGNTGVGAVTPRLDTAVTLTSIGSDGGSRIAHLTTSMAGEMNITPPGTASADGRTVTMHIAGEGTMDLDLDRGLTKAAEQRYTADAEIVGMSTPGGPLPAMHMHGTIKMSQSSTP